jgi:hypothetical protein
MSSDQRVGHGLQGQVAVGREARIVVSEAAALRPSDLSDDGGISSILPTPSFARTVQVQKPLVRKIEIRQADQGCPRRSRTAREFHLTYSENQNNSPPSRLDGRGRFGQSSPNVRRVAMDAITAQTSAVNADGKGVWSWHPDAGVKLAK